MGMPNFASMFQNIGQVMNMFRQFMSNPIGAFISNGINLPPNVQGDPNAILNYLRSSGTMKEDQYNQSVQAAQMAQNIFGKKF